MKKTIESSKEQKLILLDIFHIALQKLSNKYEALKIKDLEVIKYEILHNKFEFEFVFKTRKEKNISIQLSVVPKENVFEYYITIFESEQLICKSLIFHGRPDFDYVKLLFHKILICSNHLSIVDKYKHAEFYVSYHNCKIEMINHSKYLTPPMYTLSNSKSTKEEKEIALKDFDNYSKTLGQILFKDS